MEKVVVQTYLFKTQGELRHLKTIRVFVFADACLVILGLTLTAAIRRGGGFHWELGIPILAVIVGLGLLMAGVLFIVSRQTLYFTVYEKSLMVTSPLMKMEFSLGDILSCEYTPFITTEGIFALETKKGKYRWKVQQPQQLAAAIKRAKDADFFSLQGSHQQNVRYRAPRR
jgi:hypothetical protein